MYEQFKSEVLAKLAWLVCNDRGGGKMTKANIEKIFSRIEKETGIFVTPHIMRHTMATDCLSLARS